MTYPKSAGGRSWVGNKARPCTQFMEKAFSPAASLVRAAYAPRAHSRPQSANVRAASAAAMTDASGLGPCLSCSRTSARARLPTRCEAALVAAPGVLLLALALAGRAAGRWPSRTLDRIETDRRQKSPG